MTKISGKVDKSNTYNMYTGNISFFINTQVLLLIKNEICN